MHYLFNLIGVPYIMCMIIIMTVFLLAMYVKPRKRDYYVFFSLSYITVIGVFHTYHRKRNIRKPE